MKKTLLALLLILTLLLSGCHAGDLTEPVYFSEVHDASTDYGSANITAGNTDVIVYHDIGVAPSVVLITFACNPMAEVRCWVKNPQSTFFAIEISGTSESDIHFYWWAKE